MLLRRRLRSPANIRKNTKRNKRRRHLFPKPPLLPRPMHIHLMARLSIKKRQRHSTKLPRLTRNPNTNTLTSRKMNLSMRIKMVMKILMKKKKNRKKKTRSKTMTRKRRRTTTKAKRRKKSDFSSK